MVAFRTGFSEPIPNHGRDEVARLGPALGRLRLFQLVRTREPTRGTRIMIPLTETTRDECPCK
jgi:hypothetical protein